MEINFVFDILCLHKVGYFKWVPKHLPTNSSCCCCCFLFCFVFFGGEVCKKLWFIEFRGNSLSELPFLSVVVTRVTLSLYCETPLDTSGDTTGQRPNRVSMPAGLNFLSILLSVSRWGKKSHWDIGFEINFFQRWTSDRCLLLLIIVLRPLGVVCFYYGSVQKTDHHTEVGSTPRVRLRCIFQLYPFFSDIFA